MSDLHPEVQRFAELLNAVVLYEGEINDFQPNYTPLEWFKEQVWGQEDHLKEGFWRCREEADDFREAVLDYAGALFILARKLGYLKAPPKEQLVMALETG